ncbi:hypothetical protein C9374_011632 [Naegleria lovaniensis]|uniref:Enoyl-CoA delta isomerase 1, mitochondrial n=1 Tax=Naegleria lovaniensis TaxID=51637 RepID=A0AA88G9V4_NAELO|nr:uncharacterized protein C9374_011632 [Naegleria lovaniensis]KAG2373967.1 hypothetical protein C9374_011632 [Naegleria lovaniensis]
MTSSSNSDKTLLLDGLISIEYNTTDRYAIISLCSKPVNSLTQPMMQGIIDAIELVEKNKAMNAIIFTSAVPKIFTAGLDLKSMYQVPKDKFIEFWSTLQKFFLKVYICPLFTISLINGQCFAGGCLFSLACDYRIIHNDYSIGLNETKFGLVPPNWFCDAYETVIGKRQCELHIQLGTLHTAQEALKIGLVDEVHTDFEVMKNSAIMQVKKWNKVHQVARRASKYVLRKPLYDKITEISKSDIEFASNWVGSPEVQKALGTYLQSLQKKPEASQRSSKL